MPTKYEHEQKRIMETPQKIITPIDAGTKIESQEESAIDTESKTNYKTFHQNPITQSIHPIYI